jgi:hypothetical protein
MFQGLECYQPYTARCGCTPECEEATEELKEVDVLRHYPTANYSGDHRCCRHPAMEEVITAVAPNGRSLCNICVVLWLIRDSSLYLFF